MTSAKEFRGGHSPCDLLSTQVRACSNNSLELGGIVSLQDFPELKENAHTHRHTHIFWLVQFLRGHHEKRVKVPSQCTHLIADMIVPITTAVQGLGDNPTGHNKDCKHALSIDLAHRLFYCAGFLFFDSKPHSAPANKLYIILSPTACKGLWAVLILTETSPMKSVFNTDWIHARTHWNTVLLLT